MSVPLAGGGNRFVAGPPLATWHAGTGDRAVIEPHFRGHGVAFGTFRCDPGDVRWTLENQVGGVPHIVFPVTPWQLAVGGADAQLITRNHAVFFNADEAFSRRDFSGDGDVNHFMVLAPDVAEELLVGLPSGSASGRFPRAVGRLAPRSFLSARVVRSRLMAGVETLEAEERLLALAADTVAAAFGASPCVTRDAPRFVEDAKALLATDVAARLALPELGRALNVSPFHLARTFRTHTGYSLHGYRLHLRLRLAADLIYDGDADLRAVAAHVGFSSHSHLTSAFRRVFGIPPSLARRHAWFSDSCALSPLARREPSRPA